MKGERRIPERPAFCRKKCRRRNAESTRVIGTGWSLISRAGNGREGVVRRALKALRSCMYFTCNALQKHRRVAGVAKPILDLENLSNCPTGTWDRVTSHCSEPVPSSSCCATDQCVTDTVGLYTGREAKRCPRSLSGPRVSPKRRESVRTRPWRSNTIFAV